MISKLSYYILTFYTTLFSVQEYDIKTLNGWKIIQSWKNIGSSYELVAQGDYIIEQCKIEPQSYLRIPLVYGSENEFWNDNTLIIKGHNDSHSNVFPLMIVQCEQITSFSKLIWKIRTPSKYFARISHFPYLSDSFSTYALISQTIHAIGAALLLFLTIFGWIFLYRKVSLRQRYRWVVAFFAMSAFCFFHIANLFGLNINLVETFRWQSFGLIIGLVEVFFMYADKKFIPFWLARLNFIVSLFALLFLIFGSNTDQILSAMHFCFPIYFLTLTWLMCSVLHKLFHRSSNELVIILSVLIFVASGMNDMLLVVSLQEGIFIFPLGLIAFGFLQIIDLNIRVQKVYTQRDSYQLDLEKSYQEKIKLIQDNAVAHTIANTVQMIAHDLNKPFSMVKLLIKQISSGNISSDVTKKLSDYIESTNLYVDGLLSDILIAGSKNTNRLEPVCLQSLIHDIWHEFKITNTFVEEHSLTLNLNHQGKLFVDALKLRRLLCNLLNNAFKAVGSKQALLWIHSTEIKQNGRAMAEIVVGNSESFIAPEWQDKVFERFQGSDVQGSGLGLAICREIVHAHGGVIYCRSDQKKGTEFIFTLPIV